MKGVCARIISMENRIGNFINWWTVQKLGLLLLFFSIMVAVTGYLNQHMRLTFGESMDKFVQDFYANFATELFSLAITVLIVDKLYENRANEEEKKRLILQMGSTDNTFAIEAVRQLRLKGWLFDGSLQKADLSLANLEKANLDDADLKEVNLYGANLHSASIQFCDLSGAYLPYADFSDSTLRDVRFENACLRNAKFVKADIKNIDFSNADMVLINFKGAWLVPNDRDWLKMDSLSVAKSLWGAILPNGKKYLGQYNLAGDIEEARKNKVDVLDADQMKKYYRDGSGFHPAIDLPPSNIPHDNWVRKLIRARSKKWK